jgi:hypothetical protein
MSAKINIETDDPALASALGILVAQAIENAGFNNVMAKTIMMTASLPVKRIGDTVMAGMPTGELQRSPPELKTLQWIVPQTDEDLVAVIAEKNPGVLDKPVLLSFYPDTCPKYESDAKKFLNGALPIYARR